MSRIHDALKKAGSEAPVPRVPVARRPVPGTVLPDLEESMRMDSPDNGNIAVQRSSTAVIEAVLEVDLEDLEDVIQNARLVPFTPQGDALLVDPVKPREAPAEEFRTLRTRLNHLQTLQPLHTLVVTSASPAEGKSFTAANLAITQSQLADKRILLADFDFRRPNIDKTFQIDCAPGITDYLLGKATLPDILRRVEGTNLYLLTAGGAVPNPLELLNLKECRTLIDALRNHFDWVVLDSPPLLFAADANLLATMCDGTILVVRIGSTTFDSVTRALGSLCENNVLGIVVNGARRGELYSKYTYYHDYYYDREKKPDSKPVEDEKVAVDASE
ncbi:MAG: CpsD/CapB family tyrosine-protein kinase [Acidobacteriota bacterium]|nr:CpsD/CapB family tyrosine-protein kinase [Acidobacteriota bacterium]